MFNEIALAQVHVHSQNYLEAMKILEEVFKNIDSKYSKMLSECLRFMGYLKSKIPPKQKEDKGAEDYYA